MNQYNWQLWISALLLYLNQEPIVWLITIYISFKTKQGFPIPMQPSSGAPGSSSLEAELQRTEPLSAVFPQNAESTNCLMPSAWLRSNQPQGHGDQGSFPTLLACHQHAPNPGYSVSKTNLWNVPKPLLRDERNLKSWAGSQAGDGQRI